MKWTKLKKITEDNFCEEFKKDISINSTRYGNCTCGHAWVTYKKEIVANFCTMAFWDANIRCDCVEMKWERKDNIKSKKYNYLLNDYGDFKRQDIYEACWDFLHNLNIKEALNSDNIFIQFLAVIDRRVGKRTLEKMKDYKLHDLVRFFLLKRIRGENFDFSIFYNEKAIELNLLKEYQESINFLNKSIEINKSEITFYINKLDSLNELGLYKELIKTLDKIIEFKPDNLEYLKKKAIAFIELKEYKKSIDVINKIEKINPNYSEILPIKVFVLKKIGE